MPDVVAKPGTTQEVSELLKVCNKYRIPTTPRGAGTGLSGGALPVKKGVVISMERFNKIIEIDEVEPSGNSGARCNYRSISKCSKSKKSFYPPDPASKGSCFLGGNLAITQADPKL